MGRDNEEKVDAFRIRRAERVEGCADEMQVYVA